MIPKNSVDNILKTKAIGQNLIYALNGCCVVLAFVLIFLELQTFFIKKPTSTEQTTTGLNFRIAPQILFCLQPAFRLEVLNSLGYNGNGLTETILPSNLFNFQALSNFSLGILIIRRCFQIILKFRIVRDYRYITRKNVFMSNTRMQ